MRYEQNDGRWPDDAEVLVRYPVNEEQERDRSGESWSWVPGTILGQCGPDEWRIRVDVDDLAEDCREAPHQHRVGEVDDDCDMCNPAPGEELLYPACWRGASEIRAVGGADSATDQTL